MKLKISGPLAPELSAGQLWKNRANGDVYLAVGVSKRSITLWNLTRGLVTKWAAEAGFGTTSQEGFEYLGNLEIDSE